MYYDTERSAASSSPFCMDLLCAEEIIWSPCSPLLVTDEESQRDQSNSMCSPPLTSSTSSIDCHCNDNLTSDSSNLGSDSSSIECCSTSIHCCVQHLQCNFTHNATSFPTRSPDPQACNSQYRPHIDADNDDGVVQDLQWLECILERQFDYMPEHNYYADLNIKDLGLSRTQAVLWFLETVRNFNLSNTTAALAINYFDRYVSKNVSQDWSDWMFDLLSIACLSTAAKMEEVVVPQLINLQKDSRRHSFNSSTVERMELLLLSTLQWKMRSVTPFSFTEILLYHTKISSCLRASINGRASELLFSALSVAEFLLFDPATMALASILAALEEIAPSRIEQFRSHQATKQITFISQGNLKKCCKMMKNIANDVVDDEVTQILNCPSGNCRTAQTSHHSKQSEHLLLDSSRECHDALISGHAYPHFSSALLKKRTRTQAFS
ncbi:hypothetical protein KP509_32G006300 [Ceratopteris richardii]|uniref:Cyclin-like domain-containing protein n=1 Tax=Ceratopteris richardii TaxID=49495 RepID=A0A8T2QS49_CERRI|nr:hypothetical protein KP509_32G006300 [Ceratopteris richardii]